MEQKQKPRKINNQDKRDISLEVCHYFLEPSGSIFLLMTKSDESFRIKKT